jgi:hypothetical protein
MIPSPFASKDAVQVGNDAGWHLSFHKEDAFQVVDKPELEFGRDDYYGDIQASLAAGIDTGVYTFTIVGLTDKHYGQISLGPGDNPSIVRLYMYWRDAIPDLLNGLGAFIKPIASLTDTLGPSKAEKLKAYLVAELHITEVTRKAGQRRYETTIKAVERMYDLLDKRTYPSDDKSPIDASDLKVMFRNLFLRMTNLEEDDDYKFYDPKPNEKTPPPAASAPDQKKRNLSLNRPLLATLRDLGTRMERESGCYGRGMYLIRNGKLHIGKRPIPLPDDINPKPKPKPLTPRNGFIEPEVLRSVDTDPDFKTAPGKEARKRKQYKLTLKGRPDLKPGDLVLFDVPAEDLSKTTPSLGGLLGGLADMVTGPLIPTLSDDVSDQAILGYVSSVEHRLARDSGFVTTVTAIEEGTKNTPVDDSAQDDLWDARTVPSSTKNKIAHANIETQLGQAIQGVIGEALGDVAKPEVGEVRELDAATQTLRIWRGLADGVDEANEVRKQDIARPSPGDTPVAPYLTPFAWSQCGLILPRYPGTRVLVEHRQGNADDPIDVGALWKFDDVPKKAQAGDWWLILPAKADAPDKFADDDAKPKAYSDIATHDLIDAGGSRIIEAGALTIRVGKDKLTKAGERPADATADSIVIEHKGNAVIKVDKDGNITIDAGSNTLTLSAKDVKVKVSGSMDVGS